MTDRIPPAILTLPGCAAGVAAEQGARDFEDGQHLNPYDHETRHPEFVAWINGYNGRKAIAELFCD
jgi:hypothetical protein